MHQPFHDLVADRHLAGILDVSKAFQHSLAIKPGKVVKDKRGDASGNGARRRGRHAGGGGDIVDMKRAGRHVGQLRPGCLGEPVHHGCRCVGCGHDAVSLRDLCPAFEMG